MAAQMLLKKGKKTVALNVKAECCKNNTEQLKTLLDHLLNVSIPIDNSETIDWCRWLIAGGQDFEEYSQTVQQYDSAVSCGLVWTANFVAYRCRTCAKSPCMSLCSNCFNNADHAGHDYNMFRSQAGGACDCGDVDVMYDCGFCPQHGPGRVSQMEVPRELLILPEDMMPRLFWRLLLHLRIHALPGIVSSHAKTIEEAHHLLSFLGCLSDMKAAMRAVMTRTLISSPIYTTLNDDFLPTQLPNDTSTNEQTTQESRVTSAHSSTATENLREAVSIMSYPEEFDKYTNLSGLDQNLTHVSILDELVFWTVHYQFPEIMVTLLLSLLPNNDYKEAFTVSFVKHYSRISMSLVNSVDRLTVANRVVHISVQLFSNKTLAAAMTEQYNLHYTLVVSLSQMMEHRLTCSTLQDAETNFHLVIGCSHAVMKDHCYWPVVSDFINILSHDTIAHAFMADRRLVRLWLEMISYLQGMNVNQREVTHHVDFESDNYYTAFSAELEICASPMWSIIQHCTEESTSRNTVTMLEVCFDTLQDWYTAIGFTETSVINPYQLTFHLPLHRYAATFLSNGIHRQAIAMETMLPSTALMKMMIQHLIQIQVGLAEIHSNMWVRNGLQIRGQAMTYVQCHFCYSMADADLYLLQVCASQLDPDYFIKTVIDRFHIADWLSIQMMNSSFSLEPKQQLVMVEAALTLLASLQTITTFLGVDDETLLRMEMCTLLSFMDRTHSQTQDFLPERSGIPGHKHETLDSVLSDVAEYKVPNSESGGKMQQGIYVPKASMWDDEFNPMHALLRMVQRKDFQSAMDRYANSLKQRGIYTDKHPPWPPFRLPRDISTQYSGLRDLLHCRMMHTFIFSVLWKTVLVPSVPESILYMCVYLLDMAVSIPPTKPPTENIASKLDIRVGHSNDWFPSNDIVYNVRHVIRHVMVPSSSKSEHGVGAAVQSCSSTLEELFDLAPSSVLSAGGPIASAKIGVFPTVAPVHPTTSDSAIKHDNAYGSLKQTHLSPAESESVGIEVNESMVSLLYKLHARFSPSNRHVPQSVAAKTGSGRQAGDGAFYISRLLYKIAALSDDCCRHDELVYRRLNQSNSSPDSSKKAPTHDRRKKAKNRQEKLMAEFASKQKAFMEQATAHKPDAATEDSVDTSGLYECVICGQMTASTRDRPIAMAVLLQPTNVLAHCCSVEEPATLMMDDTDSPPPHRTTQGQVRASHLETLMQHFDEESCQMSVNGGWHGGIHCQSCGHYVHLDCHSAYVQSLTTQVNVAHQLKADKGEYFCPLCRQLCNSIVPIIEDSAAMETSSDDVGITQAVQDVARSIATSHTLNISSPLTRCMTSLLEDIAKLTHPMQRILGKPSSNSIVPMICSVARTNLELDLLQRGGTLCAVAPTKTSCLMPLLKVLATNCKFVTVRPQVYSELWSQITGIEHDDQETSQSTLYEKAVPLLLKDISALLIYLMLSLPPAISISEFRTVVQMLYNVVYIQGLAVIACKFSSDERSAWKHNGKQASSSTLEGMMSHVITRLECSRLFEDEAVDSMASFIQDVWTPLCVDSQLADHCVHFLRLASLLQSHLFPTPLPHLQSGHTEFNMLASYLQLDKRSHLVKEDRDQSMAMNTASNMQQYSQGSCTDCVQWAVEERLTLTRSWCMDLVYFINQQPTVARDLLRSCPLWYQPRLIALPHDYYRIFQHYMSQKCRVCSGIPTHPALCLVCGTFLCFKQACCRQEHVFECIQHSVSCGSGTGIFLLIYSSTIMVVRGARATLWGSLYLDEHGEEDRDLKRGKPLYLDQARYLLLESQWMTHSFDHSCKRWIWHLSRF